MNSGGPKNGLGHLFVTGCQELGQRHRNYLPSADNLLISPEGTQRHSQADILNPARAMTFAGENTPACVDC